MPAFSTRLAAPHRTITTVPLVRAAIDARIDKVLRRLTSLKEYKRIDASQDRRLHSVESPSVVPALESKTKATERS
jgi:hypothetical protein